MVTTYYAKTFPNEGRLAAFLNSGTTISGITAITGTMLGILLVYYVTT